MLVVTYISEPSDIEFIDIRLRLNISSVARLDCSL